MSLLSYWAMHRRDLCQNSSSEQNLLSVQKSSLENIGGYNQLRVWVQRLWVVLFPFVLFFIICSSFLRTSYYGKLVRLSFVSLAVTSVFIASTTRTWFVCVLSSRM